VAFKNATDDNLAPTLDTKQSYIGDINDALLSTCANVNDVIAFYQKYNDVNTGYATFYAADKSGDSVKITWDFAEGELSVNRSSAEFNSLGYGANVINSMFLSQQTISKSMALDMLKASAQTELTLYSNIFDLNTGEITLYHNQNFDHAVWLKLSDELCKGPHIVSIASLFGSISLMGDDVINPQTLLPVYIRILIYAMGACMLFSSVYFIISLIKDKQRTKIKMTTHLTAIIAGIDAVVILTVMYFRWSFLLGYGFEILGTLPHILAWVLVVASLLQAALCIIVFIKKHLTKSNRIIYLISSILLLIISAEMLLSGLFTLLNLISYIHGGHGSASYHTNHQFGI